MDIGAQLRSAREGKNLSIGTVAERIRVNNWDEVGFSLIKILLTVSCIDQLSKTIHLGEYPRSAMAPRYRVELAALTV